jgi:Cu(I)/Ag(I) efflux system membrane fusion protein
MEIPMDEQNKAPEPNPGTKNAPETPAAARKGRRGRRKALLLTLAALVVAAAAFAFRDRIRSVWEAATAPAQGQTGHGAHRPAASGERKILYWQDPMHPQYRSDKPGKAPDCGMDLVPVYEDGAGPKEDLPEGAFQISPAKQQLVGVQYGEVKLESLSRTIRAVGRLAYDETRIVRVHSKIEGWLERVHVDFTGKLVERNQPLVDIYSPELVATQEEYLLALKAREKLGDSQFKEVAAGAASLLGAARRRLELWDITDAQIDDLTRARKPARALTLYSPASGFVLARSAYPRQRVTPETELYAIANLEIIWAIADIYEYEAPLVRLGQPAVMSLSYFPGRTFRGKVTYIYPQLDNATRTLKVRAEFSNPDFALKPDMYADVELRIDYGRQLSIPQEAVLDSGTEQTVFVALHEGYFEPRKVRLGGKVGERTIVLDGVRAGERVVTSGNFLVDSESRLKSAAGGMGMPGMQHGPASETRKPPPAPADPSLQQGTDHSKHQPAASEPKAPDHSERGKKPEPHRHD